MSGLVLHKDVALNVEAARDYLAKSVDMIGVKELKDKAQSVQQYMRARGASLEAQNAAAEIALRATRRLGELTKEMPKAKGAPGPGRGKAGLSAGPAFTDAPTLAAQGIKKSDAAKWQAVAAISEADFNKHIETTKKKPERLTTHGVLAPARLEKKRALAAELNARPIPEASGQFHVIVVDPPWNYENRADDSTHKIANPYPGMSMPQILALPVGDRAESNCVLWLWTTNSFMREAFACLDAWGFQHKTILTWTKNRMGTGDWLRGKTEHCLMAVRGKPLVTLTTQTTWLAADVREHSRKPEEFFALVEALCPGSKLEFFSRAPRSGWVTWGAESQKFSVGRGARD